MALAPLSAGACRTEFVILTAKPIAGHAQRASGGNSGQDDPAAAGALDVDPGRRQAPALDHRRAPHPGRRPCRRTPRQSRPPLRSSKRLPGTSVSLPGITLSDKGGQGERAHCRRSGRSGALSYRFKCRSGSGRSVRADAAGDGVPDRAAQESSPGGMRDAPSGHGRIARFPLRDSAYETATVAGLSRRLRVDVGYPSRTVGIVQSRSDRFGSGPVRMAACDRLLHRHAFVRDRP